MARARDKLVQVMLLAALWLTPAATAGPVVLTIDVSGPAGVAGLWRAVQADTVATPSLASVMPAGSGDSLRAFITTTGGGGIGSGEPAELSHTSLWEAVYARGEWRAEALDLSGGIVQIVVVEASSFELFEVRALGGSRSTSIGEIALARPTGFLDRRAPPPPPPSMPLPSAGMMALAGLALLGARRRR